MEMLLLRSKGAILEIDKHNVMVFPKHMIPYAVITQSASRMVIKYTWGLHGVDGRWGTNVACTFDGRDVMVLEDGPSSARVRHFFRRMK